MNVNRDFNVVYLVPPRNPRIVKFAGRLSCCKNFYVSNCDVHYADEEDFV